MKIMVTTHQDNIIHSYTIEISRDHIPSVLEDDLDAGYKVELESMEVDNDLLKSR